MNIVLLIAGILGFSSLVLGAYGDHGLQLSILDQQSWDVALRYHQLYAVVLLVLSGFKCLPLTKRRQIGLNLIAGGFFIGAILFSGSIYLRILSGYTGLSFLTPIGGSLLILSWLAVMAYSFKYSK
jgi:uncharacterized membrane protein YgdD (TMEM256/DUF423 family)